MAETPLNFNFPPVSAKGWKQKIQVDLKGADYNEKLVWESLEGIKVKPFYHREDTGHESLNPQNCPRPWVIGESIKAGIAENSNKKAKAALKNGAESLCFVIEDPNIDPETLLEGIDLSSIPVHINMTFLSEDYVAALVSLAGSNPAGLFLHLDLLGHLGRVGNWYTDQKEDHRIWDAIFKRFGNQKNIHLYSVDMGLYQNSGANVVQQLAYGLAHVNEYLNHAGEAALPKPVFKVAIGPNYFFEIAKLRAMRILWETLAKEYDADQDCHILAIPSRRNKTLYDYNTNMLRTTTECMAAVLGQADTIVNLPYDALYHESNDFGDRIAKNQLLLLKNESHLDKVSNPASGSYYIETLTRQLAEKALQLFKQIEAGGGFLVQLKNHTIQKKIKESARKEQQLFDEKKLVLVGTNTYENPDDRMRNEMELNPFPGPKKRKTLVEPLLERRLASGLEQKRLEHE